MSLVGEILFFSVPPSSNSLVSVSCVASRTTGIQGHHRCSMLGVEVPRQRQRTTDTHLDCAFVESMLNHAYQFFSATIVAMTRMLTTEIVGPKRAAKLNLPKLLLQNHFPEEAKLGQRQAAGKPTPRAPRNPLPLLQHPEGRAGLVTNSILFY